MKQPNCTKRKGLSLTEAMMATVVLSMAAAGVLLPFTSGAIVRAEGMRQTLAASLANDLMEGILSSPFGSIVEVWDDWSDPPGQPVHLTGEPFTDTKYAEFRREASCEYVYMPQETGAGQPKFIRVRITVYHNDKEMAVVTRLISK